MQQHALTSVTPLVHGIFDANTWTVTYVVYEKPGAACVIIDSVLDYDPKSGRTSHGSADRVIAFVQAQQLKVEWILETHAHADHVSGASYLKKKLGGKTAIGEHIIGVQKGWPGVTATAAADGSQFDALLADEAEIKVGQLTGRALFVPGHTPACADPTFYVPRLSA